MRFFRRLLICLGVVLALVAFLTIVALTPFAQTWLAEKALTKHLGVQTSVGSASAGFSKIEMTEVRLQADGAVLTLPSVEASLPIKAAMWDGKMLVRSVVAKGWTLDLSGRPVPAAAAAVVANADGAPTSPDAVAAEKATQVFRGLLSGWRLPCDVSLDGAELEGDVLMAAPPAKEPVRMHVILKGGGMEVGHEGTFVIDATGPFADSGPPLKSVAAHGQLAVGMRSPRTIDRIEFKGSLSSDRGSLPEDLSLLAGVTTAGDPGEENYTLDFTRGTRHLAAVVARFPKESHRFEGTWKLDLRDSDLARIYPVSPPLTVATAGEGNFDADVAFTRVHATGRLKTTVNHWGILAPALDRVEVGTLDAGFDLTHSDRTIHVERMDAALAGTRPIAIAHSVQPFTVDERTGSLKVADSNADWLEGSLQGLPLAFFSDALNGLELTGGDATGDFVVKAINSGFALRSKAPLVATGVSVQKAGQTLAQGLDLSLALLGNYTPQGWQVQGAPLMIGSGGRHLATVEAKMTPLAERGRWFTIAGTWSADLEALASQPAVAGIDWIKGRSATGDFSANLGTAMDVKGKINVIGHDPGHTVTASGRVYIDAYGGVSVHVPVTVALGSSVAEFTADGSRVMEKAGPRLDLELTSVNVDLHHLGFLVASLPAAHGIFPPTDLGGSPTTTAVRDQRPFWGDLVGRVRVEFYRLKAGADELNEVAGTFNIDHGTIRLEGGRGALAPQTPAKVERNYYGRAKAEAPRSVAKVEGAISFDAAAEFPYSLKATAAIDVVDAARLFPAAEGHEPLIEGRFSVADTLTGNGITLADLVGRRQEEFRLASNNGIVRLLKTSVAESIPEAATPVSDAIGTVGSALGTLLGKKENPFGSGMHRLSKPTEAVLNFTSQVAEIGCDKIAATAIRGSDGTIHLAEIVMNAQDERLTGTGQITYVKGRSLLARPLSLELKLGARGGLAKLLSTAGLLSSDKDDQGYTLLRQPARFGGTLEHIDESSWHDLLLKAATPAPDRGK